MISFLIGKIPNQVRDDMKNLICHAEPAAKSVETMSKRDFMPLPSVSGSDQLGIYVFGWGNTKILFEHPPL